MIHPLSRGRYIMRFGALAAAVVLIIISLAMPASAQQPTAAQIGAASMAQPPSAGPATAYPFTVPPGTSVHDACKNDFIRRGGDARLMRTECGRYIGQ